MKKIKVFYGNQHVTNVRVNSSKISAKSEFKRIMKEVGKLILLLSFISGAIMGTYAAGSKSTSAQMVYASIPVLTPTMPDIPVMDRIIKCESGGHQFNSQGQVLIHVNTNGTYDTGIAQINSIWDATATKMGYDLTKQSDNIAFAQWLFINKGSSAWTDSSNCWNK